MIFQIRKAMTQDIEGILMLENTCFTYDQMSRTTIRSFIKKKSADVFVAEMDKSIIGSLTMLYRANSDKARLYSIAVLPDHRNLGIAAALCHAMEHNASQKELAAIILEVKMDNVSAIRFYEKHGYHAFDQYKNYYDDGCDALRMIKTLNQDNAT